MQFRGAATSLISATAGLCLFVGHCIAQESEQPQAPAQDVAVQPVSSRLFVSDKLVLNVYSEPQQGGERVGAIETGDVVVELERAEGFVRVRLADGREGWVGASYLTADPPAVVRLRELQREQRAPAADKKSLDEIARLRKQNSTLESELKALRESAATQAAVAAEPAQTEREDAFDDFDDPSNTAPPAAAPTSSPYETWLLALLAAAIGALIGFAAGYQVLARRVRAKFGGLKVYQ